MSRKKSAKKKFERDLVVRKEAVVADGKGKLPPGATHEITGKDDKGEPVIKRGRFSIK